MNTTIETKWFYFSQNNSGGSFDEEPEKGIGTDVFIEAVDAAHANDRAEDLGIYFYGCESGRDCPCCGNRWAPVDDSDGGSEPCIYGMPLKEVEASYYRTVAFLHPINGGFQTLEFQTK